jgi:hypothetical protein
MTSNKIALVNFVRVQAIESGTMKHAKYTFPVLLSLVLCPMGLNAQTLIHVNVLVRALDKMPIPTASMLDAFAKSKPDTKTGYYMKEEFDMFRDTAQKFLKAIENKAKKPYTEPKLSAADKKSDFRKSERDDLLRDAQRVIDSLKNFHGTSDSVYNRLVQQKRLLGVSEQGLVVNTAIFDYDNAWDDDRHALSRLFKDFQDYLNDSHYGDSIQWKDPKHDRAKLAEAQRALVKTVLEISETNEKLYDLAAKVYQLPAKEPVLKLK